MQGDDRVRNCSLCAKNVYNIADMTRAEAERFLAQNGFTKCMRIAQRQDGTIITDDCPVALRKIRNGFRIFMRATAAALGFIVTLSCCVTRQARAEEGTAPVNRESSPSSSGGRAGTWGVSGTLGAIRRLPMATARFGIADNKWKGPPANVDEMCRESEWVVIAEYRGYKSSSIADDSQPPDAQYRVTETLKGNIPTDEISVRYELRDSTAEVESRKSQNSDLPQLGTKFVLCLSTRDPETGVFETHSAARGRFEANSACVYAAKQALGLPVPPRINPFLSKNNLLGTPPRALLPNIPIRPPQPVPDIFRTKDSP
jgi:hypothetical protein